MRTVYDGTLLNGYIIIAILNILLFIDCKIKIHYIVVLANYLNADVASFYMDYFNTWREWFLSFETYYISINNEYYIIYMQVIFIYVYGLQKVSAIWMQKHLIYYYYNQFKKRQMKKKNLFKILFMYQMMIFCMVYRIISSETYILIQYIIINFNSPSRQDKYMDSSTVIIKNGIIGKASHGVHANNVENIIISNLKIYNFDVAGVQYY